MNWSRIISPVFDIEVKQEGNFQFILAVITFLLFSPVVLWMINHLNVRTYFTISFVWFLICSEVFVPSEPKAVQWEYRQWIKTVGWIVLTYIMAERVIAVLG